MRPLYRAEGPGSPDILVTLGENHRPTEKYVHDLRLKLAQDFPGVTFAFLPADIVSQILNFGLPAPIDIQVVGNNLKANREVADALLQRVRNIPGTTDLRIQQPFDQPYLNINVDRTLAGQVGYTQHDVAQNLLISLSGSFQTSPTFWLNPKNGVSYSIATQTPQYRIDTLQGLENVPLTGANPSARPATASLPRGQPPPPDRTHGCPQTPADTGDVRAAATRVTATRPLRRPPTRRRRELGR